MSLKRAITGEPIQVWSFTVPQQALAHAGHLIDSIDPKQYKVIYCKYYRLYVSYYGILFALIHQNYEPAPCVTAELVTISELYKSVFAMKDPNAVVKHYLFSSHYEYLDNPELYDEYFDII
jgi:hypothetical protein